MGRGIFNGDQLAGCFGLTALWGIISVYIGSSPREREKKREMIDERKILEERPNPQLLQSQKALILLSFKLVASPFLILELYPFDLHKERI